MVKGVFAEEAFGAGGVAGEEAGDAGAGGGGLGEGDGFLKDHGRGGGVEGDVGEALLFGAGGVAEGEVELGGGVEAGGEVGDENVVAGGDGTLDAPARRGCVFADAGAAEGSGLEEGGADDHAEGAGGGNEADGGGEFLDLVEAGGAVATGEQVELKGFFVGGREEGEPVVGEEGGVNGAETHRVTPRQWRSW